MAHPERLSLPQGLATTVSRNRSLLLLTPGEIRTMIYEFVLFPIKGATKRIRDLTDLYSNPTELVVSTNNAQHIAEGKIDCVRSDKPVGFTETSSTRLSLLLINRQLHDEVTAMLPDYSVFMITRRTLYATVSHYSMFATPRVVRKDWSSVRHLSIDCQAAGYPAVSPTKLKALFEQRLPAIQTVRLRLCKAPALPINGLLTLSADDLDFLGDIASFFAATKFQSAIWLLDNMEQKIDQEITITVTGIVALLQTEYIRPSVCQESSHLTRTDSLQDVELNISNLQSFAVSKQSVCDIRKLYASPSAIVGAKVADDVAIEVEDKFENVDSVFPVWLSIL